MHGIDQFIIASSVRFKFIEQQELVGLIQERPDIRASNAKF
jgi:hypothetical protein